MKPSGLILFVAGASLVAAASASPPAPPPRKSSVAPAATAGTGRGAATRDWTRVATTTAAGDVILGNPQARVKVIEYLSFTCSHCAEFSIESAAELKGQLIRSGSTSIEYRPIGRDLIDLGATLLVRCAGGLAFAGAAEEIFERQREWLPLAMGYLERDAKRFALSTPLEQVRAGAQVSGLVDLMRARGLSSQRIDACFADEATLDKILANGQAAQAVIKGTPSIVINGKPVDAFTWNTVEPLLRAAGAR